MKQTAYITTPIYYVNSRPHLGTLYTTLLADAQARYQKLAGKKVFFMTGTDEHGQKIEEAAKRQDMLPHAFVDSMVEPFRELFSLYEISYHHFMRTTDAKHIHTVVAAVERLIEKGDIYLSLYKGAYCTPCETFVARGSSKEEQLPSCPSCHRATVEIEEEAYFFRLSAYQEQLLNWYSSHPHFIEPKERAQEVISFVQRGLVDLCASRRNVSWGIPFPKDPACTVYVWFDALLNYLSGIGYPEDETYLEWWPAVHYIGKDIVKFHAVYWPALLMALDLPLPRQIVVHGFIMVGDQKMSKSLGNSVHPIPLAEKYGVEQVRYYLLRQMAITHDGVFEEKDIITRCNSELSNNIGNLLTRVIALVQKQGITEVKAPSLFTGHEAVLKEKCVEAVRKVGDAMDGHLCHIALSEIAAYGDVLNRYVQQQQIWLLARQDKEKFAQAVSALLHGLWNLAVLLWPFIPRLAEKMCFHLGVAFSPGTSDYLALLRSGKWNISFFPKSVDTPIFPRLEEKIEVQDKEKVEEKAESKNEISFIDIQDVAKVSLVVGTIQSCTPVPNSPKLLKLLVDVGEENPRTILSGVKEHYTPEALVGKQGVFIINLKPRKMAGEQSYGMMLFATDPSTNALSYVTVSSPVLPGSIIK